METAILTFLIILQIYFLAGLAFGVYFILFAKRIDPLMGNSKKVIRLLLFPGVVATWPFLIKRLFQNKNE
ncbi:hypothetical protein [Flagellimonas meridianipacifica]|uniref:Uncharacterized protein n=1 Tax=Flagellimonas meridianipacifica TaxID=1080225 RepID=A0A2T0MK45_9FLAO|nr:hypothetical protein [Allomuricauda pacifica]PRX57919.1 hypothetical protein CLV81_1933 [Allomuricauda pacifica]